MAYLYRQKLGRVSSEFVFVYSANTCLERGRTGTEEAESGEDEGNANSSPKRVRKTKKRAYVPAFRSGGYALILALSMLPEDQLSGLTKEELQERAQPYCDSSFKVPSDPTKFYTAWQTMASLQKKSLVYSFGRPAKKYALTDEGWDIAKNIKATLNIADDGIAGSVNVPLVANIEETSRRETSQVILDRTSVKSGDECRKGSERYRNKSSSTDTRTILGILDNSNRESSFGPDTEEIIRQRWGTTNNFLRSMATGLSSSDENGVIDPEALDLLNKLAQAKSKIVNEGLQESTRSRSVSNQLEPQPSLSTSRANTRHGLTARDKTADKTQGVSVAPLSHLQPIRDEVSTTEIPSYQPVNLRPGSFTVELLLDTREVRTKNDRNYIQTELAKLGITCEQRALQVGDMVWVARIHDQAIIEKLDMDDRKTPEVVLDYVVERKRLDDLDASIKDKRFLEQKFRLKRSGIQNGIYIIEDYGSVTNMEDMQHTRMVTSIAATQILDGFFVKRTRKLDDSIKYLACMTKLLKKTYESRSLNIIPTSVLTAQNHLLLRAPKPESEEHHYITYQALASLASKSSALTVRDVFLKMLMCSRGITGDKAIEVQRYWQTPRSFVAAYKSRDHSQVEKKELLWRIAGDLMGKRKIGKAVSQKVGEVWGFSNP
jgi:crossover junction endonuclease MUS81